MNNTQKPKGPWIHRFLIVFFTAVFAVLVYWALGFLVEDIRSIPGPLYPEIEKEYLDPELAEQEKALSREIAETERAIAGRKDELRIIGDTSGNLQGTINQLLELQRLAVQKSAALSDREQADLSESLAAFLESQQRYQAVSAELSRLTERKKTLLSEKNTLERTMEEKGRPAREEFDRLIERHNLRLAALQLAILLPLLAVSAFLVVRKRKTLYFPLFLGFASAVLVKSALVIHQYFPTRYVRYMLVAALLAAVGRLVVYFIRSAAFPDARQLWKQHREGYEHFLCPVCEFPIRRGPRKYLFWTRRSLKKLVPPEDCGEDEPYCCPSCGTVLFEECPQCGRIRHALLPWCEHCCGEKNTGEDTFEEGSCQKSAPL